LTLPAIRDLTLSCAIGFRLPPPVKPDKLNILSLEKKIEYNLEIEGLTRPVKIIGTIDRIDKWNGQLRILDYKTGSVNIDRLRFLSNFSFKDIADEVDTIITDIPEPWEFFMKNKIEKNLNWVSYLPSITQVEKIVIKLNEHNFINIKIMETLNREWIVDKKIVRPKNEMVGHTGFVVSARFLSN